SRRSAAAPGHPGPPQHIGQSPGNHRHLVRANVCGGSHDVPQPPHGNVRVHADAGRRGAGGAQRLLPGQPRHAGVTRPGAGHRCCPSGVLHSTSRNGPDPRLSGAATPSTARSAFY
ncbi:unnamed protein product, partial [Tetraodon nigroviridis]